MITDYKPYIRASNGDGPAVRSWLSVDREIGDMSVIVDSVLNWPPKFVATIGTMHDDGSVTETTVFLGHLEGSVVMIDEFAPGYFDEGNQENQVAFIKPASVWADIVAESIGEGGGGGASVTISDTPPEDAEPGDLWGDTSDSSLNSIVVAVASQTMPIGSTYFNKTNPTNPATLLGFGTWARLEGVVLGGRSETGGSPFNVAGGTVVGADTHTLTAAQMQHTNYSNRVSGTFGGGGNWGVNSDVTGTIATSTATPHPIVQRTLVGYLWERTA